MFEYDDILEEIASKIVEMFHFLESQKIKETFVEIHLYNNDKKKIIKISLEIDEDIFKIQ